MPDTISSVNTSWTKQKVNKVLPFANPGVGSSCVGGIITNSCLASIAEQDPRWTQNRQMPRYELSSRDYTTAYVAYLFDGGVYHKPITRESHPTLMRAIYLFDRVKLGGRARRYALAGLKKLTGYETVTLDPRADEYMRPSLEGVPARVATPLIPRDDTDRAQSRVYSQKRRTRQKALDAMAAKV